MGRRCGLGFAPIAGLQNLSYFGGIESVSLAMKERSNDVSDHLLKKTRP